MTYSVPAEPWKYGVYYRLISEAARFYARRPDADMLRPHAAEAGHSSAVCLIAAVHVESLAQRDLHSEGEANGQRGDVIKRVPDALKTYVEELFSVRDGFAHAHIYKQESLESPNGFITGIKNTRDSGGDKAFNHRYLKTDTKTKKLALNLVADQCELVDALIALYILEKFEGFLYKKPFYVFAYGVKQNKGYLTVDQLVDRMAKRIPAVRKSLFQTRIMAAKKFLDESD